MSTMNMPVPRTVAPETDAWDAHRPASPTGSTSTTSTLTGSTAAAPNKPQISPEQLTHPAPHIPAQTRVLLIILIVLGSLSTISSFVTLTFFDAFIAPSMFFLTLTFAVVLLVYARKEAKQPPEVRHANGFRMPTSAQNATIASAWILAIGWLVVVGVIAVVYYLLLVTDEHTKRERPMYFKIFPFVEAGFALLQFGCMVWVAVLCMKEKKAVIRLRAANIDW
ncbi:hypothetical protein D9613_001473 [Agrocybe pediades]|uniref:Uncharacterized protein n=1 Tax=Agrocybe pediades TaxID=84607 RepID=A0A8H4VX66_9AGAR|nr:hypothetical protein D9613_001473 [Agrocybe pediades]